MSQTKGHFYFMKFVKSAWKYVLELFGIGQPQVNQRIGYWGIEPPPVLPVFNVQHNEEPPRMLPDGYICVNDTTLVPSPRITPSPTLSLEDAYYGRWCGTTVYESYINSEYSYDKKPLKHFLMKEFKWIENVTEVKKRNVKRGFEIYITVSPVHHTELMNSNTEKIVREKLHEFLEPLVPCIYGELLKEKPLIIFSPSHSETILEYFK